MGRKKLTSNQKQYRKLKKERHLQIKRLGNGKTRQARTSKSFRIEPEMKDHLTKLTIDRVQTQGEVISDLIFRCLSYAVENQKKGRQANKRDRNVESVRICVLLKNGAVETLEEYCKLTGNTRSATVNRLIKVASLEPVLDHLAANALFSREERRQAMIKTLREGGMSDYTKKFYEIYERIGRELDEEYGVLD